MVSQLDSKIRRNRVAEVLVCAVGEMPDGATRIIYQDDLEIGIIHQGGEYYAYRNYCPHQGGPACEGLKMPAVRMLIDDKGLYAGQEFDRGDMRIVCPWHGYEFSLASGVNVCDARLKLKKYDVVEREGQMYVRI